MRILTIIVVLTLSVTVGFSAEKEPAKKPEESKKQELPEQRADEKKKSPSWPRPYQSTEEISVDSSVPFPTDI